jgi:hypothetical protein
LADEWSADYPGLLDFAKILHRRSRSFKVGTIQEDDIENLCLSICATAPGEPGILHQNAMRVVDCAMNAQEFRIFLIQIFYRIGLVGLKLASHEEPSWSDRSGRSISTAEIVPDMSVVINAKYSRALGIDA